MDFDGADCDVLLTVLTLWSSIAESSASLANVSSESDEVGESSSGPSISLIKSSLSAGADSEFPQPIAADNVSPVKRIAHFENDIELLPSLGLTARNRAATRANLPRTKGKRKDASCDLVALNQVANASADVTSKGALRFGRICRFPVAVRRSGG